MIDEDITDQQESEFDIRSLRADDLNDIIRIDAQSFGRPRPEYYKLKLKNALEDTSLRISLVAERDGVMVGFLMGSVFYGDFGQPEPVASLEAISVLPELSGHGVGRSLWKQFSMNVKAMRIDRVHTQVEWSNDQMIGFLRKLGFAPAQRICLEKSLNFESDE